MRRHVHVVKLAREEHLRLKSPFLFLLNHMFNNMRDQGFMITKFHKSKN